MCPKTETLADIEDLCCYTSCPAPCQRKDCPLGLLRKDVLVRNTFLDTRDASCGSSSKRRCISLPAVLTKASKYEQLHDEQQGNPAILQAEDMGSYRSLAVELEVGAKPALKLEKMIKDSAALIPAVELKEVETSDAYSAQLRHILYKNNCCVHPVEIRLVPYQAPATVGSRQPSFVNAPVRMVTMPFEGTSTGSSMNVTSRMTRRQKQRLKKRLAMENEGIL